MAAAPELSIIIPTGKDPEGLTSTLAILVREPLANVEIVVGNDGSYEEISAVCERFGVREVKITPNRGSYSARNLAAAESQGRIFGFLDAGVIPCAGWCELARSGAAGADYVAGDVRHEEGASPSGTVLYQDLFAFGISEYFAIQKFGPTANLVITRELFETMGGFNGRLRSSGDHEFGDRVAGAGKFTQVFDAERYVLHPYRSFSGLLKKELRRVMGFRHLAAILPERFSTKLPGNSELLKLLFPPKCLWLLAPGAGSDWRRQLARQQKFLTRVTAYGIFYALKLTSFWGYLRPLANPDSFEWKTK